MGAAESTENAPSDEHKETQQQEQARQEGPKNGEDLTAQEEVDFRSMPELPPVQPGGPTPVLGRSRSVETPTTALTPEQPELPTTAEGWCAMLEKSMNPNPLVKNGIGRTAGSQDDSNTVPVESPQDSIALVRSFAGPSGQTAVTAADALSAAQNSTLGNSFNNNGSILSYSPTTKDPKLPTLPPSISSLPSTSETAPATASSPSPSTKKPSMGSRKQSVGGAVVGSGLDLSQMDDVEDVDLDASATASVPEVVTPATTAPEPLPRTTAKPSPPPTAAPTGSSAVDGSLMHVPNRNLLPDGLSATECAFRAVTTNPKYAIAWRQLGYFLGLAKARQVEDGSRSPIARSPPPEPGRRRSGVGGVSPAPGMPGRKNIGSDATTVSFHSKVYDSYKCYLTALHLDPDDAVTWKYASAALCVGEYYEVSRVPEKCKELFKVKELHVKRRNGDDELRASAATPGSRSSSPKPPALHINCDATLCLVIAVTLHPEFSSAWSRIGTHLLRSSQPGHDAATDAATKSATYKSSLVKDVARTVQILGNSATHHHYLHHHQGLGASSSGSTFVQSGMHSHIQSVAEACFSATGSGSSGPGSDTPTPSVTPPNPMLPASTEIVTKDKVKAVKIGRDFYTAKDCFLTAVKTDPTNQGGWNGLGAMLKDPEMVVVTIPCAGGHGQPREMRPYECFVVALELDDHFAGCWYNLGCAIRDMTTNDSFSFCTKSEEEKLKEMKVLAASMRSTAATVGAGGSPTSLITSPTRPTSGPFGRGGSLEALDAALSDSKSLIPRHSSFGSHRSSQETLVSDPTSDHLEPAIRVSGVPYTQRQCLIKALELNPTHANAWAELGNYLATNVEERKTVIIGGRDVVNTTDCFTQALCYNPRDAQAWEGLGCSMKDNSCSILRGVKFSKPECFANAVKINPLFTKAWSQLGEQLTKGEKEEVEKKNAAASSSKERNRNIVKKQKATYVPTPSTISVHGPTYNARLCYIRALETTGGQSASGWYNLARTIPRSRPDEKIPLLGQEFGKIECHVQALSVNPNFWTSYHSLGVLMPEDGEVMLMINGREVVLQKSDCLAKYLEHHPNDELAWFNLGSCLGSANVIDIPGHGKFTDKTALVRSLELKESAGAWVNLGGMLGVGETVQIKKPRVASPAFVSQPTGIGAQQARPQNDSSAASGSDERRTFGAKDCFASALKFNTTMVQAWLNLGCAMSTQVTRSDGTVATPREGEVIPVLGAPMSKRDCLVRALELCHTLVRVPGHLLYSPAATVTLGRLTHPLGQKALNALCEMMTVGEHVRLKSYHVTYEKQRSWWMTTSLELVPHKASSSSSAGRPEVDKSSTLQVQSSSSV